MVFPDLLEKSGYFIGHTGKGWAPGDYKASGRQRNPAGPLFSGKTLKSPEGISNVDYAGNFARFLSERPDDRPFFFWLGTHEPHRRFTQALDWKSTHSNYTPNTATPIASFTSTKKHN